jgi:hypothetical protein
MALVLRPVKLAACSKKGVSIVAGRTVQTFTCFAPSSCSSCLRLLANTRIAAFAIE